MNVISRLLELHLEEQLDCNHRGTQRWIEDSYGNILPIRRYHGYWDQSASDTFLLSVQLRRFEIKLSSYQLDDELVFCVYATDHSHAILRVRLDERAGEIKLRAARKLKLRQTNELILVHVKSNGERIIFNDSDTNLSTGLSVNGRIFVCPLDHIDAISPLPDQDPFQEANNSNFSSNYIGAGQENCTNKDQDQTINNSQLVQFNNINSTLNNNSNYASGANMQIELQQQHNVATALSQHLLNQTPSNLTDTKTQMSLSNAKLEEFSSRDIAYCLTQLAWSLLKNMHEYELIYAVFGHNNAQSTTMQPNNNKKQSTDNNNNFPDSTHKLNDLSAIYMPATSNPINNHNQKPITANLNVFLRHFNELQYWVVTQICLSTSLSKRAQILRKFIKIAAQ